MINKVTILLLFTAIFCACSDEDYYNYDSSSGDGSIGFAPTAASLTATSRALESSSQELGSSTFSVIVSDIDNKVLTRGELSNSVAELDEFGVFTFETTSDFSYTSASSDMTLMDNVKVTIDHDDDDACYYLPTKFWPTNTDKLTFLAYAPYLTTSTASESGLLLEKVAGENNFTINYTIPSDATKQPDLMVADIQRNKTTAANAKSKVPENFKHALAAVGFRVRGNDIKLKRISISNLADNGDMLAYDEGNSDAFSWTLASSKSTFNAGIKFDEGESYVSVNDTYVDVTRGNGYMMMLPQELGDDVELTINYDLKDGTPESVTVQINTTNIKEWSAGKKYMYNLTITPYYGIEVTPVYFDYTGAVRDYKVTSIYIPARNEDKRFVDWEIDKSSTPIPYWITNIVDSKTDGSVDGNTYSSIAQSQTESPDKSSRNELLQKATAVENLNLAADGETANCYIISAAGSYYFPANVMGVGDSGVDPTYARNYLGQAILTADIDVSNAYAKLLWQTEKGLITSVELKGDNIHFTTAESSKITQGNALIAIVNKGADKEEGTDDDIVMWNWHIWSTNINPETDSKTFDFPTNTNTFLPIQLGFEDYGEYAPLRKTTLKFVQIPKDGSVGKSCVVEFIQDAYELFKDYHCLYYKWGKKDPYTASKSIKYGNMNMYDIENESVDYTIPTTQTQDPNKNFGISTPMTMEWHNTNWTTLFKTYPDVWANSTHIEKSIYDPCPKNYHVPRRGAMDGTTGVYTAYNATTNKGGYSTVTISSDGKEKIIVAHCGGIYGRIAPYFRNYKDAADCNYIWFSHNRNASAYAQNRYSYLFRNGEYKENTGQASSHMYWVMPFKYK